MAQERMNYATVNSNPAVGISLCIPRVFNNINWRRIKQIFIDLHWGHVERVDLVPKGAFKRAFVHFAPGKWNVRDQEAMKVLAALKAGTEVKIVYDEPWYWKIGLSRAKKPAEAPKPKPRPVVHVGAAVRVGAAAVAAAPETHSAKKVPKLKVATIKTRIDANGEISVAAD